MMPSDSNTIEFKVGHLDGRLTTMESRMDRHETEIRSQFALVHGKLDSLLAYRSERTGVRQFGIWGLGVVLAVLGLIFSGSHQIREFFHALS